MAKIQDYIGHTLGDLVGKAPSNFKGYGVFVLQSTTDTTGKRLIECFSLRDVLREHPETAGMIVKLANDFYGQTILRVIDPALVAGQETPGEG